MLISFLLPSLDCHLQSSPDQSSLCPASLTAYLQQGRLSSFSLTSSENPCCQTECRFPVFPTRDCWFPLCRPHHPLWETLPFCGSLGCLRPGCASPTALTSASSRMSWFGVTSLCRFIRRFSLLCLILLLDWGDFREDQDQRHLYSAILKLAFYFLNLQVTHGCVLYRNWYNTEKTSLSSPAPSAPEISQRDCCHSFGMYPSKSFSLNSHVCGFMHVCIYSMYIYTYMLLEMVCLCLCSFFFSSKNKN